MEGDKGKYISVFFSDGAKKLVPFK